mmetsp:Transcript_10937/g.19320  ORF Transcript_10937/g.19320 Transcript_10937/m.19320 type:complete len:243 (+) Transcript_10937:97-825(+)|eukprot:CAMPEP_0184518674 /NCGR_PEP_ID=MMETSP0198_2-20121128/6207_1 /TAXON_ID=1112570 /ORGANISM="Thraustochytrium sp., Strain LLF1b" /LENGTH=242 /DNA_ID=CAMNT_0026909115 /DNA_START=92 /DNA_END=817 /DNA_ORIENTATION=+
MNRNQYDTDVTTWSPQGKLHQVEYAMESVKQGSCSLGIRGKDVVVLAALKRSVGELSSYQKKIFKIDDHIGVSISGLTADARVLAMYMRTECLNYKFQFDSPIVTGRLASNLADKHQSKTQASWKRPYGVGLLIAGFDRDGPHLYETCPSGNLYEYNAMAIGLRAQSAKTYLEKHLDSYKTADVDTLIMHALKALEGPANDKDVAVENASVAIVGKDSPFEILEGEALKPYLDQLESSMETE